MVGEKHRRNWKVYKRGFGSCSCWVDSRECKARVLTIFLLFYFTTKIHMSKTTIQSAEHRIFYFIFIYLIELNKSDSYHIFSSFLHHLLLYYWLVPLEYE